MMIKRMWLFTLLTMILLLPLAVSAQQTPPEVEVALADMNARLGTAYTLNDLDNWSWSEDIFNDASLGCPQPDQMYAAVISRAYIITLLANGQVFDYRAPSGSGQVIFCSVSVIAEATDTPAVGGTWEYTAVAGNFNPYLAWSPSGEFIAVSGVVEDSGETRGRLLLYDPDDLEAEPAALPLPHAVTALDYVETDPAIYLATGSSEGDVVLIPVEPSGSDSVSMDVSLNNGTAVDVAVSSDAQVIASSHAVANDPALRDLWAIWLWDATTGAEIGRLDTPATVISLDFAPYDALILAAASSDGTVALYDAQSGDLLATLGETLDAEILTLVAFSPDGERLAVAVDTDVTLWDVSDPQNPTTLRTFTSDASIRALDFGADGSFLAVGGGFPSMPSAETSAIQVWDTETGALAATLSGHTDAVNSLAFSPDGSRLASISFDGTLRVWEFGAVG